LIKHGGYVLEDNKTYDLTIIATGSEVGLAHEIIALLKKDHLHGRLVSVPCVEIFNQQTENYIQQTLGNKPVFSLEFASTTP
jgi:transketolase